MAIVPAPAGPTHELPGTRFTSLATPSRGSAETAIWTVEIDPGTPATPHSLTREEIFVVLDGVADVSVDGRRGSARPGDAVVVPAGADLEIGNGGTDRLRMLCCLPVGGQGRTAEGVFTPPWAQ